MNPILAMALPFLLPLVLGSATSYLYGQIKKASDWVDGQPAQVHAFLVGAASILLPLVGKYVPGFTATDLAGISAPMVQSVLALVASQVTHAKTSK